MIYCENFTKRELVSMAMPLAGLSREQWRALTNHIGMVGSDPVLKKAFEKVLVNQARIEVISDHYDYYGDEYDNLVREKEVDNLRVD